MGKNKKKKIDGFYENPEAIKEKLIDTEVFVTNNRRLITGILLVVVVVIVGLRLYDFWIERQEQEAQNLLSPAIFFFEKGQFELALSGDDNTTDGFLAIIEDYPLTKAANLSNFYAGVIYLSSDNSSVKQNIEQATEHLENFESDDLFLQARAFALLGDAYVEQEVYEYAIEYYKKAVNYKPNRQFTPLYLLKLGLAQQKNLEIENARATYEKIIDSYPNSVYINKAKKYASIL